MRWSLCRQAWVCGVVCLVLACRSEKKPTVNGPEETAAAQSLVREVLQRRQQPPPVAMHFRREGPWLRPTLREEPVGTARIADVWSPSRREGALRIADGDSGLSIDAALIEPTSGFVETASGIVVIRNAMGTTDLLLRTRTESVEATLWTAQAPSAPEVSFNVTLGPKVTGLRQVGPVLEFLDAGGAPRLRYTAAKALDARGAQHAVTLAVVGCAYDESAAPPWHRPVTVPGAPRCTVQLRWPTLPENAYPLLIETGWSTTGSMLTPRAEHAALVLPTGLVLVSGGSAAGPTALASTELYEPTTGTWSITGPLHEARTAHTMTLLGDGKVLAAGGSATSEGGTPLASAELFDAYAGLWTPTKQPLHSPRAHHSATMLADGSVLLAGGTSGSNIVASAEVYVPGASSFQPVGSLSVPRRKHAAVRLGNNQVLVLGGQNERGAVAASELFDPTSGAWTLTGSLQTARYDAAAQLLRDNSAVVALGGESNGLPLRSVEWYRPQEGAWTTGPDLSQLRGSPTVQLLDSGLLFVTGGAPEDIDASTETGDPSERKWAPTSSLAVPRLQHAAVMLGDGRILIVGGRTPTGITSSVELHAIPRTCQTDGDCVSGHCADGFCCNTACDAGSCDRCDIPGQQGTCSLVPAGTEGSPSCAPYACDGTSAECVTTCDSDTGCATGFFCQYGTCLPQHDLGQTCVRGAECTSGFCADHVCCDSACGGACDVCATSLGAISNGTCTPLPAGAAGSPACSPFVCRGDSGVCPARCTEDAHCAAGLACVHGACVTKVALGGTCELDNQCSTGHCADGVCCDLACEGGCSVCAKQRGAVGDGTCTLVAAGQPGDCERALCDGASAACPERCHTDANCSAKAFCVGGICIPRAAPGTTCSVSNQCIGGICRDGRCAAPGVPPTDGALCSGEGASCVSPRLTGVGEP